MELLERLGCLGRSRRSTPKRLSCDRCDRRIESGGSVLAVDILVGDRPGPTDVVLILCRECAASFVSYVDNLALGN